MQRIARSTGLYPNRKDEDTPRNSEIEKINASSFSIGRHMFDRRQLGHKSKQLSGNPYIGDEISDESMGQYLDLITSSNAPSVGRAALKEELFVEYVSRDIINEMLRQKLAGKKNTGRDRIRNRVEKIKVVLYNILQEVQEDDGFFSGNNLENIIVESHNLEEDETVDWIVDPGPFSHWGIIGVGLSSQPAMIDDATIGLSIVKNNKLVEDFQRIKEVVREVGLNSSAMDVGQWEPVVPIFHANYSIHARSNEQKPITPEPPSYVKIQPFTIR